MKRTFGFLLLAAALARGDVLQLKDGTRVSGKVVDKSLHYEVTAEGMLRTYLKEEVEKVISSPKELLGDADALYEAAKADYSRALQAPPAEQNAVLREAISKIARAREAYAGTLDLFPEDDALGKKLMLIMQLTRLLRERVGSEVAKAPANVPPPPASVPPPPAPATADEAFAVLVDPVKRGDPARRSASLAAFKARRRDSDLASAASTFLSRSDAEMRLEGAALKAAQDYLQSPACKGAESLPAAGSLQALQSIAALKANPATAAAADALQPFALVHAGLAGPSPDAARAVQVLGFSFVEGVPGTPEGHAVRDLLAWISSGDFGLAVLAFIKEHRAADTPSVRFVWSYALLRLAAERKRGWDRPASAYDTVKGPAHVQEHAAALSKSVRTAASCNPCAGEGRLRCTNCHGRKEIRIPCARCKGAGKSISKLGAEVLCPPCRSTGLEKVLKCEKCKDGYTDCRQCDAPKAPPPLDDIASETGCADCGGSGMAFRRAAVPCRACLGLGRRLVPKADPARLLPP